VETTLTSLVPGGGQCALGVRYGVRFGRNLAFEQDVFERDLPFQDLSLDTLNNGLFDISISHAAAFGAVGRAALDASRWPANRGAQRAPVGPVPANGRLHLGTTNRAPLLVLCASSL
jgi:hypothetical protein